MIRLTGLAEALRKEIEKIPVIDCHEHLPREVDRVKEKLDPMMLFHHYCVGDIEAAGLRQGEPQDEIFDASTPIRQRWRKFQPYFDAIRFGSYAYPAITYVREVLGIDEICEDTIEEIGDRLQADNKPGLYQKLFGERCGIEKMIECVGGVVEGEPFFVSLTSSQTASIAQKASLDGLAERSGQAVDTLDDCVAAVHAILRKDKDKGAVGMKVADAYWRTLQFDKVETADAQAIFEKVRADEKMTAAEYKAFEDYMMFRQVASCVELALPVVIHTGYQAGNRGDIRNVRATHLWALLYEFPDARFDLFHGSFPYVSDMTVLGKYFENVTLNMCWMHIMGPAISRRALDEWLDAVPVTKIFAFGGDYSVPEKVYGHLQLARADVAAVLAEKVQAGRMGESEALHVARLVFYENAKRWYSLD